MTSQNDTQPVSTGSLGLVSSTTVRLERKLKGDKYVFEREGVYFVLTKEDVQQITVLLGEQTISLPPEFVATKYPGYFWNLNTQHLYSIKSGVLKRLKKQTPSRFNEFKDGWRVSHEGRRRWLLTEYLSKLQPSNTIIPVDRGG